MNNLAISKHNYIVACGPLASGKTSLMKLVSENFNYRFVNEDLGNNLYFSDYYLDMSKWGFHASIVFLINAIETQKRVGFLLKTTNVCQDWYVREVHDVYNVLKLEEGILSKRDYEVCCRLDGVLRDITVQPNKIIYLKANIDTLWGRVLSRRRQEEVAGLSKDYLTDLVEKYDNWIQTVSVPVITIDTSNLDFVNNLTNRYEILHLIREMFSSL